MDDVDIITAREARELARFEANRIPKPDYQHGHCQDCAEPIGEHRRRAAPYATRCVGCQDDYESRNRVRRKRGG